MNEKALNLQKYYCLWPKFKKEKKRKRNKKMCMILIDIELVKLDA